MGRQAARHATHTHTYHTHAIHFRRMTLPVPIQAGFAFLPYYATHAKSMPQRDTSRDRGGVPRISTHGCSISYVFFPNPDAVGRV